jgi:hypothetical protein
MRVLPMHERQKHFATQDAYLQDDLDFFFLFCSWSEIAGLRFLAKKYNEIRQLGSGKGAVDA